MISVPERLIAVGSLNPVKLAAAENVLRRAYGDSLTITAVDVASGVSEQPWGDAETLEGALNRARAAQETTGAWLGVGLEGGVMELQGTLYTNAWCAVVTAQGESGYAGGANCLLPPVVAEALRNGKELGTAIDALTGDRNTKHQGGAIGALTGGLLDRQGAYEQILAMAMARLMTPTYYGEKSGLEL